jgi:hypothetical protein
MAKDVFVRTQHKGRRFKAKFGTLGSKINRRWPVHAAAFLAHKHGPEKFKGRSFTKTIT